MTNKVMRMEYNHKGKWHEPTLRLTNVPCDLLMTILGDARTQIERELQEKPDGGCADYNKRVLATIIQMEGFFDDAFPGKEEEIKC